MAVLQIKAGVLCVTWTLLMMCFLKSAFVVAVYAFVVAV